MDDPRVDLLDLADWRRQVAELYGRVRAMAGNPAEAHGHWREDRERLYREHPASPVPEAGRSTFRAIHFAYDPSLRFEVPLLEADDAPSTEPPADPGPGSRSSGSSAGTALAALGIGLPVSTGQARRFDRVGWLEIPFQSGPRRLELLWLTEYSGGLFLAFRDATNGRETYGGGRYLLDTAKGADLGSVRDARSITVDFNFAYQPSCAFDPAWSCPLPSYANRLDIAIRAGERIA